MAFAELGVVFTQNQAVMGEHRRFKTESPVKHDLQGRVGQVVFTADHVRDCH